VRAERDASLRLLPNNGEVYGAEIELDATRGVLTRWTAPAAHVAWWGRVERTSTYDVVIDYASPSAAGNSFELSANSQRLRGRTVATGSLTDFRQEAIGKITIGPGRARIVLRSEPPLSGALMDLRGIRLVLTEPPRRPAPAQQVRVAQPVRPEKDGVMQLRATSARIHGPGLAFEPRYGNLGQWFGADGYASWTLEDQPGGTYAVWLDWACQDSHAGNKFQIRVGDQVLLTEQVSGTGTWDDYRQEKFGEIRLAPGKPQLIFRSEGPIKRALIDLRTIRLVPAPRPGRAPSSSAK